MRDKITEAIKDFYRDRFDEYTLSPEEIADLVLTVLRENIPAEEDYRGNGSGWNDYRKALLKVIQ